MGSRVNLLAVISVMALLGSGLVAISPAVGADGVMCPPVTIDVLYPDTTTTTAPPTTAPSTTAPSTTTAPPTTAPPTTAPPTSSTTTPPTTDTTTPRSTSTTVETTVPPTTETTAADESSTTTIAPTTTAPSPTTTTPSPTTTAPTTTTPPEPPCDVPFEYPMVFPLLGGGEVGSGFGADRDGGRRYHMGNDVFAAHLQPVVAVSAGTVAGIGADTGRSGYSVRIRHDDGWSSLYIHLNNDTAGTDDGSGIGIRPDLAEGDRVEAGEVIGWNGDSGNAENTPHHLHFELRMPSGDPVDPGPSLAAAERLGDTFSGPFADLEGEVGALHVLLSRGVPVWCDDPASVCPDDELTQDRLDEWMRALGIVRDTTCEDDCPTVTAGDIARSVAWSQLHTAYAAYEEWLDGDIPDASWSTPPRQPPAESGELDLRVALGVLGGLERCLTVPDDARTLSTSEAAETLALHIGWSQAAYCRTNAANR